MVVVVMMMMMRDRAWDESWVGHGRPKVDENNWYSDPNSSLTIRQKSPTPHLDKQYEINSKEGFTHKQSRFNTNKVNYWIPRSLCLLMILSPCSRYMRLTYASKNVLCIQIWRLKRYKANPPEYMWITKRLFHTHGMLG